MERNKRIMSDLLTLSVVPRWVIVGAVRYQSVAEHSYRVAVIARSIALRWNQTNTNVPPGYLSLVVITEWALLHDGAECITGDLPAIVKHGGWGADLVNSVVNGMESTLCPWYAEAKDEMKKRPKERAVVKIADLLEGASFIFQWGRGTIGASASIVGKDTIFGISTDMVDQAKQIARTYGMEKVVDDVLKELELL